MKPLEQPQGNVAKNDLQGILSKQGRKSKLWVSRWVVLRGHCLYIYAKRDSKQPKRKSFPSLDHFR